MKVNFENAYQAIMEDASARGAAPGFIRMSERYAAGHWKRFVPKHQNYAKPLIGWCVL